MELEHARSAAARPLEMKDEAGQGPHVCNRTGSTCVTLGKGIRHGVHKIQIRMALRSAHLGSTSSPFCHSFKFCPLFRGGGRVMDSKSFWRLRQEVEAILSCVKQNFSPLRQGFPV